MRLREIGVLAWAAAFALAGCGSSGNGERGSTYSLTAKANYDKGMQELKDENYPEAQRYFTFVKQKFPFSRYAVLAELRLADTNFDRGRYLEAVDQYKMFGRSHPTHEFVEDGYVGFKICEAYYKQMPDDFFLIPPAHEKDQSATRDALRELDQYLERWPSSKYADKARQYRIKAVRGLARTELYVAQFYMKRDKYQAAAWRLETLLKDYKGSELDPPALLLLGQAYEKLKNPERARDAYTRLLKEHPKAAEAREAQALLQRLPPAPPRATPPTTTPATPADPTKQG